MAAQAPIVTPRFWTGQPAFDAKAATVDCSGTDMAAGITPGVLRRARAAFETHGLVLLANTGLGADLEAMGEWGKAIMGSQMKYEGGANARKTIVKNVYETGAPRQALLHYHHEMAYVSQSTSMLCFSCAAACDDTPRAPGEAAKGATFLSHNALVTDALLATELGTKLKEKGICYIRCLTDALEMDGDDMSANGVYNTWQQSFGVTSQEEAEKIARSKGLHVEWGPGRYMRTKHYTSAFEYHPATDCNMLYSSIADHGSWFDTWPGVMELPYMECYENASPAERPLKITYGDDTDFTADELRLFCELYDRFGFPINWKQGDVAVVCNYRFAHGRPGYELEEGEERTLGVQLGPIFDRVGQRDDKW
eukprot:TRINITY_DN2935_c0_g1_i1.p1 TRINITY_DN2935_c0_g1~~TRINITY_DN2935_c0_g1_i1.p1  ORF type:complete len:380 (-),score=120.54 TRINITY_DN2935_c0_g1_i1:176-1273(-)